MKDTKTIIEQAYSAFNKRDIDGALALMTQDVSWPKASEGGKVVGKEEIQSGGALGQVCARRVVACGRAEPFTAQPDPTADHQRIACGAPAEAGHAEGTATALRLRLLPQCLPATTGHAA
jgi:hypothetical protein